MFRSPPPPAPPSAAHPSEAPDPDTPKADNSASPQKPDCDATTPLSEFGATKAKNWEKVEFEDEAKRLRKQRRQRAFKRIGQRTRVHTLSFVLGGTASYMATAAWTQWPLMPAHVEHIQKACVPEDASRHPDWRASKPHVRHEPTGVILNVKDSALLVDYWVGNVDR